MTVDGARENIDKWVRYKPWPKAPRDQWELGKISSVGETGIVFVQYMSHETLDERAKATSAGDLRLV